MNELFSPPEFTIAAPSMLACSMFSYSAWNKSSALLPVLLVCAKVWPQLKSVLFGHAGVWSTSE